MSEINCGMRLTFAFIAVLVWLGIFMTGFDKAHWTSFIPAIGLFLPVVTGLCPGAQVFGRICPSSDK